MDCYRYLVNFDTKNLKTEYHDVLIIGSGIAGVYTALNIDPKYDVAILTKESIEISNSVLAQGGIAVSLDKTDSPEFHFRDTIYAGAGLCSEESVWVLVNEAAENVKTLLKYGVQFDMAGPSELSFGREAAHSKNRIIHAGDTTGKEVCDKLVSVVRTRKNIIIKERIFVIDLVTENGECRGLLAYDVNTSEMVFFASRVVVCATGGFGQLYEYTTNPEVATGDGVSLAYRAGAQLADLEFIQFHPTVLYHPQNRSFLITEAVRGEGGILRNAEGKRFMPEYHELAELAPRDVVSRAIFMEMKKTGKPNVYLDITFKPREWLEKRFPNIFRTCLGYGIDISKDYIPVAPAEHYCMGGIKTDIFGRTKIKGFYACGEAACSGIHGANRLASNSLLEGLVFGNKIAGEINRIIDDIRRDSGFSASYHRERKSLDVDINAIKKDIQKIMIQHVGIIRDRQGLELAREKIARYREMLRDYKNTNPDDFEVQNMLLLSYLVIESALEREESRGAHFRADFDRTDDINWKRHIIKERDMNEV